MKFFSPVTKNYVPTPENIWGGTWVNVNPYLSWYEIAPGVMNYHTGADLNNNKPVWNADYHSPVFAVCDGEVIFSGAGDGT